MRNESSPVAESRRFVWWCTALVTAGLCGACADEPTPVGNSIDGVEAISLLGDTLRRPVFDSTTRSRLEGDLERARADYAANPLDADAGIWYGRRLAYLGRYQDAIEIFTAGVRAHPDDPRFFRHRGHRYITTRQFDLAIEDFVRATRLVAGRPDEVEPDGAPNQRGIPTSTLQSNIWYHLGLVHYLRGDFEQALSAYRECLQVSGNPDMQVATRHWLYMTLRRLGRADEAAEVLEPIHAEMDIIENNAYHRLLLMYKGALDPASLLQDHEGSDNPSDAATAYGVGNWYLYNGDEQDARQVFSEILAGPGWAAFGYIAAEAEMVRIRKKE